ncbi:hypothetical protein HJFPF1_01694 [Paramyrothecium foliicola]|nr:hypothetical protein HJFPF1_01694 [Paramyrothecium foliicola]
MKPPQSARQGPSLAAWIDADQSKRIAASAGQSERSRASRYRDAWSFGQHGSRDARRVRAPQT